MHSHSPADWAWFIWWLVSCLCFVTYDWLICLSDEVSNACAAVAVVVGHCLISVINRSASSGGKHYPCFVQELSHRISRSSWSPAKYIYLFSRYFSVLEFVWVKTVFTELLWASVNRILAYGMSWIFSGLKKNTHVMIAYTAKNPPIKVSSPARTFLSAYLPISVVRRVKVPSKPITNRAIDAWFHLDFTIRTCIFLKQRHETKTAILVPSFLFISSLTVTFLQCLRIQALYPKNGLREYLNKVGSITKTDVSGIQF